MDTYMSEETKKYRAAQAAAMNEAREASAEMSAALDKLTIEGADKLRKQAAALAYELRERARYFTP